MSTNTITSISLQNSPEYLPRLQRVIECLAEDAGMDGIDTREVELIITEAYRLGSSNVDSDPFQVTLTSNDSTFTANIDAPSIRDDEATQGLGSLIKKAIGAGIDFIRSNAGFTLKLTKRKDASAKIQKIKVKKPVSLHLN